MNFISTETPLEKAMEGLLSFSCSTKPKEFSDPKEVTEISIVDSCSFHHLPDKFGLHFHLAQLAP